MLTTVAVGGYRSLRDVVVPLGRLTVVTGANGSGKSNLYRALRLLAACAQGGVVGSLAREGGLQSVMWAGPESLAGARRQGYEVQGTMRKGPISLRLGVSGDELGYLIDLGIPPQGGSMFDRDPHLKREVVFAGPVMRPATALARRRHSQVEIRDLDGWLPAEVGLDTDRSMLTEFADPVACPELWAVRRMLRAWRFYDGFRVDVDAPMRHPQVGTRTRALADDGHDLAAALQTIVEDGANPLAQAVADAFDGARLEVVASDGLFDVVLHQPGMLRPLRAAELSDGTLRYLLWIAALLTVDPPPLLVVNEPETSLHPRLTAPLARLIGAAASRTQVLVVTHSDTLIDLLDTGAPPEAPITRVELEKDLGETRVVDQGLLTRPAWEWGRR